MIAELISHFTPLAVTCAAAAVFTTTFAVAAGRERGIQRYYEGRIRGLHDYCANHTVSADPEAQMAVVRLSNFKKDVTTADVIAAAARNELKLRQAMGE